MMGKPVGEFATRSMSTMVNIRHIMNANCMILFVTTAKIMLRGTLVRGFLVSSPVYALVYDVLALDLWKLDWLTHVNDSVETCFRHVTLMPKMTRSLYLLVIGKATVNNPMLQATTGLFHPLMS